MDYTDDFDYPSKKFMEETAKYMQENYPGLWEQFKTDVSFPRKSSGMLNFKTGDEISSRYSRFVELMNQFEQDYHSRL